MREEVKTHKKSNNKKKVNKKNPSANKKITQKKRKSRKIVTILSLIIIVTIIIVLILFSDLFNITKITVVNNSKVTEEEIIQNSGLKIGNNMFKTLKVTSKTKIKNNPYIEDVKISKKLNGEIIIDVKERTVTYMLQKEDEYVYINNQGYILEKSDEKLEIPIIIGYSTTEFVEGNRINVEDLKKLGVVIELMGVAKNNGINKIITTVDISDENNYILEIPSEGKIVQFGDKTNINVKILWIVDLISREKGIEGEIVLNVPDIKKVYFREKV